MGDDTNDILKLCGKNSVLNVGITSFLLEVSLDEHLSATFTGRHSLINGPGETGSAHAED